VTIEERGGKSRGRGPGSHVRSRREPAPAQKEIRKAAATQKNRRRSADYRCHLEDLPDYSSGNVQVLAGQAVWTNYSYGTKD